MVPSLVLFVVFACVHQSITAAAAPGPGHGSVSATVTASPLRVDVLGATHRTHVGGRITVVVMTRNLGDEPLEEPAATLSYDESGLRIVSHRVVRDGPIPGRGIRLDKWVLEAREAGTYIIVPSLQAVADGTTVTAEGKAALVFVRCSPRCP